MEVIKRERLSGAYACNLPFKVGRDICIAASSKVFCLCEESVEAARAVYLSPSKRFTRTDGKPAKDRDKLGGKEWGRDYRSYLQLTHKPAFPVLTLPSSRVFAQLLGGGGM